MTDALDESRPLRLRCTCLVINAADDLRVEQREVGELGPNQVLMQVGFGGIAARTCTTSTRGGSARCASSGR